jgi:hypothetical protein
MCVSLRAAVVEYSHHWCSVGVAAPNPVSRSVHSLSFVMHMESIRQQQHVRTEASAAWNLADLRAYTQVFALPKAVTADICSQPVRSGDSDTTGISLQYQLAAPTV